MSQGKLDRLTDALVENILTTSDAEILQEAREDALCPIHGIPECMCDDPAEWAKWTSQKS